MNEITIKNIGTLRLNTDHWVCNGINTKIGNFDLCVDSKEIEESKLTEKLHQIFGQIESIDIKARSFLSQNVSPEELAMFGNLSEPNIMFTAEDKEGEFTIFYDCSNDEEIVCGVEFREFTPFDLTIGD
jgi:hypothetical protein